MLILSLATALLSTLAPAPTLAPATAPLPIVAQDDCSPTGNMTVSVSYGPDIISTNESTYQYTCPDGTVITRTTHTVWTHRLCTRTTVKEQATPEGDPCPSIVSQTQDYQLVSEVSWETGQVCGGAPGVCCISTGYAVEYETKFNLFPEVVTTVEYVDCPDGTHAPVETTTTTWYYDRRAKTTTRYEPLGDCDPGETCSTLVDFGPWKKHVLYQTVEVTNHCEDY